MRAFLTLLALSFIACSFGQLTLPFSGTDSSASISSFQIIKSGASGRANTLYISQASNTSDVILVNTVGLGRAAYFSINNSGNGQMAVRGDSNGSGISVFGHMTGTGRAGLFRISNPSNASNALHVQTDGSGIALRVDAGSSLAAVFEGEVHVSSAREQGYGLIGWSKSSQSGAGLMGRAWGSAGKGVLGIADDYSGQTVGVEGVALSPYGIGVRGVADDRGIYPTGSSFGGFFESPHLSGKGVYGLASTSWGTNYGGWFVSRSTSGTAAFGHAQATSGTTYGLNGRSDSPSGYGVYGLANAVTGQNFGVYGRSKSPTNGWAMYANGRIGATIKSWQIDHPFEPETKYLNHYCTEGPAPQNAYNGIARTDAQGYAWVQLPDYFEEINRDFRYQLTTIDNSDEFVVAKVTKPMSDNRFQIRSSKPNVDVSWEVKGTRNDRYVRAYGAPVEVDKPRELEGTYLHPELFGKAEESRQGYMPEPAVASRSRSKR